MKKLMFAFACAASVCALADGDSTGSWINFEGMVPNATNLGVFNDSGEEGSLHYFSYESASGSTDGSIVKKYGSADNIAETYAGSKRAAKFMNDQTNEYYLELSTEGGTLWRNFTTSGDIGGDDAGGFDGQYTLGSPVPLNDLAAESQTVYVDTLVQFTPTEDGTAPTVSEQDQMAIWLNVDSTDPEAPVTNLCVLAAGFIDGGFKSHTFKVPNKDQGGIDVVPGQWYRLTVKAIDNMVQSESETYLPAFKVYLDGNIIKTDTPTLEEAAAVGVEGILNGVSMEEIANGSVFLSLWDTPESTQNPTVPTFTAVGFKGSGAIDDLVVSTEEPNIFEALDSLDFTLEWGSEISAVSYTINGATATAVNGEAIECDPNAEVTLTVTLAEPGWYTVDAESAAGFTVTEAGKTHTITASPIDSPIADELIDDVKAWAKSFATPLTPEQIAACAFAKNAYLMNTDLSAEPGLAITSITEVEDGWQITVKGTQGNNPVTLKGINGQLNIKAAATLEGLATAEATPVTLTDADFDEAGVATIKVTGDNKNFMKATVGVKATTPAAE